ncbi:hypothetical protein ABEI56_04610 [Peribacillus castrilensis]|uniref:hypothetical protein n=1 Tax=Bacillaceae TaxID=186817 RepID=UPI001A960363|nr:hypothetical protein [Bacillus sp. SD075]MBO0997391.1 hypothetical protein [Bacillus sp. SD075]
MSDNYHDVRIKELNEILIKQKKENELHSIMGRIMNASDGLTLVSLLEKTEILMKYGFINEEEFKFITEKFEMDYK